MKPNPPHSISMVAVDSLSYRNHSIAPLFTLPKILQRVSINTAGGQSIFVPNAEMGVGRDVKRRQIGLKSSLRGNRYEAYKVTKRGNHPQKEKRYVFGRWLIPLLVFATRPLPFRLQAPMIRL